MIGLNQRNGFFNTYSGIEFNFLEPTKAMIDIHDISHGLAYKGHFAGQTPQFFSIAQHCLLVVDLLPPRWRNHKPDLALAALLHDAAQAYIGDMIKPIKEMIPLFTEIENKILRVIFEKFNLKFEYLKQIKKYDNKSQEIEFNTFFVKSNNLNYLHPEEALHSFMNRYYELINKI